MKSSVIRTLVLAAVIAAGCDSGSGPGATGIMTRDSAGITITENPSPDDSANIVWWRLSEPEIDIGGVDAEEPYAVFRVTDALRLSDGRIAVASSGSDDIRIFDGAGVHLRSSGRAGGGPGEYQNVNGLERGRADSLLVVDATARRISVLDPEGTFIRVFTVGDNAYVPRVVGRFADGSLLAAPAIVMGPGDLEDSEDITRPPFVLIRMPSGGGAADTLGEFPGAERVIRVSSNSSGELMSISVMGVPYGKSPTFAVAGDEVWAGVQDGPEIRAWGADGALRRIVRTGRAPEPVTEAHLDAAFEEQVEAMPEERQAEMRAAGRNENQPHGDVVPPYGQITTDATGNLWVADYDDPMDPPGRWTVYDSNGAMLARLVLPARFTPYDIGNDWVLGRELDDLDVEHVRLYRIIRPD